MKFTTALYIIGMSSLAAAQAQVEPKLPSGVPKPSESLRPLPSFSRAPLPSFSHRPRPSEPALPPRPSGSGLPGLPSHSVAPRPSASAKPSAPSGKPPVPTKSNEAHSRTHHSFTISVRPTPPAVPKPSKSIALPPKPTPKSDEDED